MAHRGASGYRPEHTLAAYQLAMELGADFVEPDLVPTKDGVLVARHESEISGTTDVALHPAFADRFTTRVVDGRVVSGWFTEDFTLDELKSLRATERMPRVRPRNRRYDGLFDVPTFDEVLDLVERLSFLRGEVIGVCPEIKRPSHFESVGLGLEAPLVRSLERRHLNRPNARVLIQSFESESLSRLRARVRVPLMQLVGKAERRLVSADVLAQVATYADAIGVDKDLVLCPGPTGRLSPATGLADSAHAVGLDVFVWTLRNENRFLPVDFRRGPAARTRGDAEAEYVAFFDAGVDGVFSDHTDTAVMARDTWASDLRPLRG
ncbi:MAG: glycerophosphodiester phosphodiesterase [Actinomycetota bacterium]|nr:glycerophosphodiester phosphodiesterase [Actinomycetota bacterium]